MHPDKNNPFSGIGKMALLILTAWAVILLSAAVAETGYRTLKRGDSGEDVYRMKEQMYQLGYFTSMNITNQFNAVTEERVKLLQKANGLPENGIADAALQELIFSGNCVQNGGTPAVKNTPSPTPTPGNMEESKAEEIDLSAYRTLKIGDSGEDVHKLKIRMYALGYFSTNSLNDQYTEATQTRVKKLQKQNGLEESGIATPELQAFIYSDQCRWIGTTPKPTRTPVPTATPVPTPTPPPMTADHFLDTAAAGQDYYLFQDEEIGLWEYVDATLHIRIERTYDKKLKARWFEAEVWCSEESPLFTIVTEGKTPGKTRRAPKDLVKMYHPVLAISDDYYAHRMDNKETVGIIIRNGEIISDKTYNADKPHFPNLETLAVFSDGSMKTYLSNELTAQEYIDLGAENVFAFGPILVSDGKLGNHMTDNGYYYYKEPRMAIGMIEPYHYLIFASDGRLKEENILGVHLQWMAQKMLERGCIEAINLDGGGTACLMFMGQRLNRTGSSIRSLGSMISFGNTEEQQ